VQAAVKIGGAEMRMEAALVEAAARYGGARQRKQGRRGPWLRGVLGLPRVGLRLRAVDGELAASSGAPPLLLLLLLLLLRRAEVVWSGCSPPRRLGLRLRRGAAAAIL
jgi:hypothetical protein